MEHAEVSVRLTARAARDEISGFRGENLIVRVTAPPVDGRANKALRRLIAKRAGVAPSKVTIVRGEHSRDKVLRIEGIGPKALRGAVAC